VVVVGYYFPTIKSNDWTEFLRNWLRPGRKAFRFKRVKKRKPINQALSIPTQLGRTLVAILS
jgi:hypothetical protein